MESLGDFHSILTEVISPGVVDKDDWITTVAD